MARSATASRCTAASSPTRGTFLDLLRLRAQRAADGGADEAARRSSSSPTTRSAWARTGRRTSRSSTRASLRLIPNLDVWRPCDTVETAVAWAAAIERRDGPSALLFTRQNVPFQSARPAQLAASIRRGGYVLADWPTAASGPRAVVIATGSEVALAMAARERRSPPRASTCASCRCPAPASFDRQDAAWRGACCPPACRASPSRPASTDELAQVRRRRRRPACRRGRHRPLRRVGARRRAVPPLRHHGRKRRRRAAARRPADRRDAAQHPRADRHVAAADAAGIARVRVDAWRTTYRGIDARRLPRRDDASRTARRCGGACSAPRRTARRRVRRRGRRRRGRLRVGADAARAASSDSTPS